MKKKVINIKAVVEWSDWYPWKHAAIDGRKQESIEIPDRTPGVYIVRKKGSKKWLLIGRTKNLRRMIRECLMHRRKDRPSSAGNKIRDQEDISKIVIQWGISGRSSAVEEELLKWYIKKYGCYPKYYR